MQADLTVEALLERIVAAAAAEVPGAQHAGVTLLTGKHLSTPVATGELVARIDRAQYETCEGPCVDAARRHETGESDGMLLRRCRPEMTARPPGGIRPRLAAVPRRRS
jgi:hypothetical protein